MIKKLMHMFILPLLAGAIAASGVQSLFNAHAVQNEIIPPTAGILTGVQYSQKIGDAFKSVVSGNKGSSAPANVEGSVVDGLRWIDDTTSLWLKKTYVNGGWATEGAYNASDSTWIGVIGGGAPTTIASSSTTDLGSYPQSNATITGTTTITSFGASAASGIVKIIRFAAALTLTHSSNLTIPCGYNLTTAANDRAIVTHLGSGIWEVTQYTRDSGVPIDCSAVGKPDFSFAAAVPALHVRGDGSALTRTSYPAYLAKVTRAQNGTRTSGNATIASVADTSGFGVGMPVESTGVNAGCTIASFVANTSITLNSSACVTSSGTSTVTVFLTGYGSGGSSSTVGVPNCSGAVLAGRETTASRLTSSYFGGNSTSMAVFSGSESVTMALANIYQHYHAVYLNDPGHTHSYQAAVNTGLSGPISLHDRFPVQSLTTGSNTTGITVRDTGGGGGNADRTATTGSTSPTPMRTVQPTLIADCVVRVTP